MKLQAHSHANKNMFSEMLSFVNKVELNKPSFEHSVSIRFLRNYSIEPIEQFLKYHLYIDGINPAISYSDFDSIASEVLDPTSPIHVDHFDIIVLSLYYHMDDRFPKITWLDSDDIKTGLLNLLSKILQETNSLILVNTFIPLSYTPLLLMNSELMGTPIIYQEINAEIKSFIKQNPSRFILLDWERYVRILGENDSLDLRYWYLNRFPFTKHFLNLYANDIARVVKTLKGKLKKCLILDCDNTLWGGIIGEDGLKGIKLDHYTYPGIIYYDFQQIVLTLYRQGVILALCSKNNERDVLELLDKHPHCLLKRSHFSAFRVNWSDKATNIVSLAQELNLGLNSFVFVDDSHVECELIKSSLPEVTVFQVPSDLHSYSPSFLREHFFDVLHLDNEDKNRTMRYQQETERREYAEKFINLEAYFDSLQLQIQVHPVQVAEIGRVAQLTQKTNQFNLSVKRYSESDIKDMMSSKNTCLFSLWVKDKFGDYGLTGIIIIKNINDVIIIDSLLLSCRILSRRIEFAFLMHCLEFVHYQQHNGVTATFVTADRNQQIQHFLESAGFKLKETSENSHHYELIKNLQTPRIDFIQINTKEPACLTM